MLAQTLESVALKRVPLLSVSPKNVDFSWPPRPTGVAHILFMLELEPRAARQIAVKGRSATCTVHACRTLEPNALRRAPLPRASQKSVCLLGHQGPPESPTLALPEPCGHLMEPMRFSRSPMGSATTSFLRGRRTGYPCFGQAQRPSTAVPWMSAQDNRTLVLQHVSLAP